MILRSCVIHSLLSLSLEVMSLKVFWVSCRTIPRTPTYDGHFDLSTAPSVCERERESTGCDGQYVTHELDIYL